MIGRATTDLSGSDGSNVSVYLDRVFVSLVCMFEGQLNHDVYLYRHHFQHLNRSGVYLDLAANHAKLISNTYFMDTVSSQRSRDA